MKYSWPRTTVGSKPTNKDLPEDQLLAYMWLLIKTNLKISDQEFERCLNDYLDDPRNVPEPDKLSSTRASIKRQLSDSHMTWKTLMKGLKIIKVSEFDFVLNTKRARRPEVYHNPLHVNIEKLIPKTDHDDTTATDATATATAQKEVTPSDSASGVDQAK